MTRFYITVGVLEYDDIQETVVLDREQIDILFEALTPGGVAPDLTRLDELSTAVDKVQGDAKVAEHD